MTLLPCSWMTNWWDQSIHTLKGRGAIQRDRSTGFNKDKCQVLHLGKTHWGQGLPAWLGNSSEKGPGCHGAMTANSIPRCLSRNMAHRPRDVIISLYSALVRVHLEYYMQFWSPQHQTDNDKLKAFRLDLRRNFFTMRSSQTTASLEKLCSLHFGQNSVVFKTRVG